jgi:hypothetical protein
LENFYNNVMFPNMQKRPEADAKIVNFNPITQPIEINKEVWEFLNEQEKVLFIKKNMPEIEIVRTATVVNPPAEGTTTPAVDENGQPVPEPPKPNEALKDLNLTQIGRIQKIVRRFNVGEITYDQAKQILMSYGLTETDLAAWLVTTEEV